MKGGKEMYLIEVKSKQAREWIKGNVQTEPWQWLGNNLAVDHHFIDDLVDAMIDAGLTQKDFMVAQA